MAFLDAFKRPNPEEKLLFRLTTALERLVELKEIELRAKGLTLSTEDLVGEILLTDEDVLAEEERKQDVRRKLGLPDSYPVGAAIPHIDPFTGRDLALQGEEEREETHQAPSRPGSWPGEESYAAPWGIGPEGAEDSSR